MDSFSAFHWLIVLFIVALIYVPTIFYVLSIQRSLAAVDEDKRPIAPGLAWLYLIPIFNVIWIYFLVVYISRGYEKMQEAGRLQRPVTGGFGVGIAFAICASLSLVPFINVLTIIPMLVLWILHWVQISQAAKAVIPGRSFTGAAQPPELPA